MLALTSGATESWTRRTTTCAQGGSHARRTVATDQQDPSDRRRLGLRAALAVALVVPLGATVVAPASAAPPVPDGAWTDGFDAATLDPRWTAVNDEPDGPVPDHHPRCADADRAAGRHVAGQQLGAQRHDARHPRRRLLDLRERAGAGRRRTFQGAGLIAYQDLDNYVRSGLTFVGGITPSGVAIENDIETAAIFAADHFEDRPGSTAETLRLTRTGSTVTTARWDEPTSAWVDVNSVEVTFPIEHVGLYALGAQDGTTFPAVFDDVALVASPGEDVVPDGPFTLRAPGTAPHLTTGRGRRDRRRGAAAGRRVRAGGDGGRRRSDARGR